MAKLTNAQLLAELTNLREHLARREAEYDSLRAELAALKQPTKLPVPEVREVPMSAFKLACARARAMAIKTGHTVRVGG